MYGKVLKQCVAVSVFMASPSKPDLSVVGGNIKTANSNSFLGLFLSVETKGSAYSFGREGCVNQGYDLLLAMLKQRSG